MSSAWLLARYVLAGLIGIAIQTSTLVTWVDVFHWENTYLLGFATGFVLSVLITFTLQKYWTFRDNTHTQTKRQLFFYGGIAITSLALNTGLLFFGKLAFDHFNINFFDAWYVFIAVLIQGFVAFLSFLANRFITFRTTSTL